MATVNEMLETWEHVVERWQDGDDWLPPDLQTWRASYQGRGRGAVDLEAIPEPYLGSWREARAAVLALNPGKVFPRFQHRGGVFDHEITDMGSYETWAASWAFIRSPWTDTLSAIRHTTSRHRFLRNWLDEPDLPIAGMLAVELYPWHSTSVTSRMQPDVGVLREYVWEPLANSSVSAVFAFGAPWFSLLTDRLGFKILDRLGAGGREYGSRVKSRAVIVCEGPSGLRVIAEKHSGSATPPASDETYLLRSALDHC